MGRVVGSVRGSLATACCRRWRFPPDRWGPLAVTGGNLVVKCLVLRREDVFEDKHIKSC